MRCWQYMISIYCLCIGMVTDESKESLHGLNLPSIAVSQEHPECCEVWNGLAGIWLGKTVIIELWPLHVACVACARQRARAACLENIYTTNQAPVWLLDHH